MSLIRRGISEGQVLAGREGELGMEEGMYLIMRIAQAEWTYFTNGKKSLPLHANF